MSPDRDRPALPERAAALIATLDLVAHPEGGWYREVFRSLHAVQPGDGRPQRAALTTIDFVLAAPGFSAWHRVRSDEAWHLLEGQALRLWTLSPALDALHVVELGRAAAGRAPRHVVPALWWQAAEPIGSFAYAGATVGPGFDFADFAFGRDDDALVRALHERWPQAVRLL